MDQAPAWSRRNNDPVYRGAVLLTALGTELAARVLSHLGEDEMERLIQRMSRLGHVSGTERDRVLTHTERRPSRLPGRHERRPRVQPQATGASDRAGARRQPARRREVWRRRNRSPSRASSSDTAPETLAGLMVAEEHPQMISVLASQLSIEKGCAVPARAPGRDPGRRHRAACPARNARRRAPCDCSKRT